MNKKYAVSVVALLGGAVAAGGASLSRGHAGTMRLFIQDTSQATIDLAEKGPGNGDLFTYHGKVYSPTKGGKEIGRFGGTCTTLASTGVPEDSNCNVDYILPRGRLFTQFMSSSADLFSGKPSVFGILGGTGAYAGAKGDGTMAIPADVPNQTDGYVVLRIR